MSTARVHRAALVVVGDELLAGSHPDLNSPVLARMLSEVGIVVEGIEVVPDDEEAIAAAVERALARTSLVVCTGGLGPTLDDVTRHGVARAFGLEVELDPRALAEIKTWFERRGTPMPKINERQALFPRGAVRIPNRVGTAPGFRLQRPDDRTIVSLPGPPAELQVVAREELVPWLQATGRARAALAERRFYVFGISESVFAEEVGDWMARDAEPRIGCSAKKGRLEVVLRATSDDAATLARLEARAAEFRERFVAAIYSESEARVELVLGRALIDAGIETTLAESCTGGLAAALLTRIAGISAVLREAFVTYADAVKTETLGVPAELIAAHGAVSAPVAEAMARGAARRTGARLALSVTGVAGPGGGSPEKPVGLVWFGTCLDGEVRSSERRFPPGERNWIRTLAAHHALFLGWRRLFSAGLTRVV